MASQGGSAAVILAAAAAGAPVSTTHVVAASVVGAGAGRRARQARWPMVGDVIFSTPLEAEDVFELAERLGEIAEAAYMLVRESDLSRTPPDTHLLAMVLTSVTAFDMLHEALNALPAAGAAGEADAALSSLDAAEHAYRRAIAALETEPDPRREMRLRELYRRAEHLASAVQRLGRRTWYAVCKIS
nr:inorganic phosphate transporter [Amycolatopsis sp. NBRC 101858]